MPGFDQILDPSSPAPFFIFFLGLWLAVTYLLSILGGWSKLAQEYKADTDFDGVKWRFQTALMRFRTRYRNCLTVGANSYGLYLSMMFLFRFGHPALFVPWSDIRKTEPSGWNRGQRLFFTKVPSVPIRMRTSLIEKIESERGLPIDVISRQITGRSGDLLGGP